jgi:hypothetical protein
MKRAAGSIVLLLLFVGVAQAQAPAPPAPYPPTTPYAPPPYQPQPYAPQPYTYAPQPQVPLTAEEHELLAKGEISEGKAAGGVLVNIFVGYGLGQAVQGRWTETGWIFTGGEVLSIAAMVKGMINSFDCSYTIDGSRCDNSVDPYLIGGLIGLGVFRVWSIVDAASGPGEHNRKVRELRMRLGIPATPIYYGPYLAPPQQGDGAVVGLGVRF